MVKCHFRFILILLLIITVNEALAQYKSYEISLKGDTINATDPNGNKVGKWVSKKYELNDDYAYEEEGVYVDGKKHGYWRKYTEAGDLLAIEQFNMGEKEGLQKYFNFLGLLEREENWKIFQPNHEFDSIPIYGSNYTKIKGYQLLKAMPFSAKDGVWKYYDPETGIIIRTEKWERNISLTPEQKRNNQIPAYVKPKEVKKTEEMNKWDKKNSGKKGVLRDGQTGF
jgi:antitoxin component YwqK of YwqJK toxin-antitoxin module